MRAATRKAGIALSLGCLLALATAGRARADQVFHLQDLGVLTNGSTSQALALNDAGHSTGKADVWGVGQAFLGSSQPPLQAVGVPGSSGVGYAINATNQIAGTTLMRNGQGQLVSRGFVTGRDATTATPLPGLPTGQDYSEARAISKDGTIAGAGRTADGSLRAVMWDGPHAAARDLGTLTGGGESQVLGINDHDVMVGWSTSDSVQRAVEFTVNGSQPTIQDLGALVPGGQSVATAIDNGGQVVGYSSADGGYTHAFLYSAQGGTSSMLDLQGPSAWNGWSSRARGINGLGWVVGQMTLGGQQQAFLWLPSLGMMRLADLVDPNDLVGWILTDATAINGKGQIVGIGVKNGQTRAFLLTPQSFPAVPEPASALLLGLGLAALAAGFRRRAG